MKSNCKLCVWKSVFVYVCVCVCVFVCVHIRLGEGKPPAAFLMALPTWGCVFSPTPKLPPLVPALTSSDLSDHCCSEGDRECDLSSVFPYDQSQRVSERRRGLVVVLYTRNVKIDPVQLQLF